MLYRFPNGTSRHKKVCHTKVQNTPGSQLQESADLQKITFFLYPGEVDEVRGTQLYFFI